MALRASCGRAAIRISQLARRTTKFRGRLFDLRGGDREGLRRYRNGRLHELLPQTFVDRGSNLLRADPPCDFRRKLGQPLIELCLLRFA